MALVMDNCVGPLTIRPATMLDLSSVQRLAHTVWHRHYPGIISEEQIDYMLARGYSTPALAKFLHEGAGLALAAVHREDLGFVAWCASVQPATTRLDKLYVLSRHHRMGIGRRLIAHVEAAARAGGSRELVLHVNRNNTGSIAAYRRCGFSVRESVITDIGGGFVMDDYVMAKPVAEGLPGDLR